MWPMKKPEAKLIVVDDEPNIRDLLSTSLRLPALRSSPCVTAGPGSGAPR